MMFDKMKNKYVHFDLYCFFNVFFFSPSEIVKAIQCSKPNMKSSVQAQQLIHTHILQSMTDLSKWADATGVSILAIKWLTVKRCEVSILQAKIQIVLSHKPSQDTVATWKSKPDDNYLRTPFHKGLGRVRLEDTVFSLQSAALR